jgi:phosphatidate cytidylyltransferase
MNTEKQSSFKYRLLISLISVPLIFISVVFSYTPWLNLLFFGLITAAVTTAVWEYYHLCEVKGYQPIKWLGMGATIAYFAFLFLSAYGWTWTLPFWTLFIFLSLLFVRFFLRGTSPLSNLALTLFAIAYLTIPLGCLISINYFFAHPGKSEPWWSFSFGSGQDGRWWLVYLLVITKITDTGAYFIGRSIGKHQFAPNISPKKTWEGVFGGLLVGILTSILFNAAMKFFWDQPPMLMTWIQSIWLGALLCIFAHFGDLAESLLKRDAGVKDSNQVPGLGGLLDIVDSLVFTAPFLFLYLLGSSRG